MEYNIEKFEREIGEVRPRIFDTWILPGFIMLYAYKSKSPMKIKARRILFISGVYMTYRNYSVYKEAVQKILSKMKEPKK